MRRFLRLLPFCAALLCSGCAATLENYADESAMTARLPVGDNRSIDLPVRYFDEMLPKSQQREGLGFINDQKQFSALWELYAREATALPPAIDFQDSFVLFAYDPKYYNQIRFTGVNVWQGIANPFYEKTNFTLAIGGDPQLRKYRELAGEKVPEPKVNVALLELPRHRKGQPGVTAILYNGEGEVLPVPSRP